MEIRLSPPIRSGVAGLQVVKILEAADKSLKSRGEVISLLGAKHVIGSRFYPQRTNCVVAAANSATGDGRTVLQSQ